MKYIPKEDVEGINSNPDHPLKEFAILLAGSAAIIGTIVYFSGFLFGELAVQMAPRVEALFEKTEFTSFKNKKTLLKHEDLSKLMLSLVPKDYTAKSPEVFILCDESPNAFALPGGKVWITSSLLDSVSREKGLAFVLAHELGHIQNKDHIRGFGQSMGFTMVMSLLGFAEAGSSLYKVPAQMSYLGLSRNTEEDADTYALARIKEKYSSYAGADEFFDVVLKKETWGSKIPSILNTHPNTEKRKARIQAMTSARQKNESLDFHKIKHGCEAE